MLRRGIGGPGRMRARRGSALVLVLVMTLSMAGLAVSAVLLSSTASFIQRYYDKDRDYLLYARAAIALVKSNVQRDTTVSIPSDTAYRALTASTVNDASGTASTIKVNGYAAYTGDTAGTYIPFLTIMAQAYDTLGVRSVRRLDLQSESFSRYQFFVDTFLNNTALQTNLHLQGRAHGNRNWISAAGAGTTYHDTLSVSGSTISGTSTYTGNGVAVTSAKRIKWPTSASLANLQTLASAGNLSFAQTTPSNQFAAFSGGVNVGGDASASITTHGGTRLRFRPVDVNNNGTLDAAEGFFEVFDLAAGMDSSNLRADLGSTATATPAATQTVLLNNCGILATISGHKEFFPVTRIREHWVLARLMTSSAPTIVAADTTTMRATGGSPAMSTNAAVNKMMSYGTTYSRCFPSGSPYLMLSERYVNGSCVVDSTVNSASYQYGWGASAVCGASTQYGGQDTTFTPNASRCYIGRATATGQCYDAGSGDGLQRVGSWRLFGGTSTANPPASVIQAVEKAYLWPISTTYNSASRGVIYASATSVLFVSDTLRGFATLYSHGRIVLIDDTVYDKDPLESTSLCRNMLGLIADTSVKVANDPMNFPRRDPGSTYRFLGTPNFNLHAIALALSTNTSTATNPNIRAHGTVAVEDSSVSTVIAGGLSCNGTTTSGGCWNHTGGAIMKVFHPSNAGAATGLVRNMTLDPCMAQQSNRRPPFFPLTGRYVDYKSYDIDPTTASTWTMIKSLYAALRGNVRPIP